LAPTLRDRARLAFLLLARRHIRLLHVAANSDTARITLQVLGTRLESSLLMQRDQGIRLHKLKLRAQRHEVVSTEAARIRQVVPIVARAFSLRPLVHLIVVARVAFTETTLNRQEVAVALSALGGTDTLRAPV